MDHLPSRTTTVNYPRESSMNHALALKGFCSKMAHINYTDVSLPQQTTWPHPISREPKSMSPSERGKTRKQSPNGKHSQYFNLHFIIFINIRMNIKCIRMVVYRSKENRGRNEDKRE